MTARQLSLILTGITFFGMAVPGSVAAEDAAAKPIALASIQDLTIESDFTVFMAPEVSAQIRTLALRKLWRLLGWESDGINTYKADYTAIEPVRRAATVDDTVPAALATRR